MSEKGREEESRLWIDMLFTKEGILGDDLTWFWGKMMSSALYIPVGSICGLAKSRYLVGSCIYGFGALERDWKVIDILVVPEVLRLDEVTR